MPLAVDENLPTSFPKPAYQTLQNFKRGVITLINESRLPKNALKEAKNIYLAEDGQPQTRPGVAWYGTAMPNGAPIDGFDFYDAIGVVHLVAVAGGNVYRSTDDGATWTLCTGGNTTPGVWTNMNQNRSFLYLTNGTDKMLRYDGTTTLQVYTSLSTPSAPTLAKTGLGATTYKYYYKVSQVNSVGFTDASPASNIQVSKQRSSSNWDASNYVSISGTVSTSATRVDVYLSEDGLAYYYLGSAVVDSGTGNYVFQDDGSASVVPSTTAPTDNTTEGIMVGELSNIGNRQFGVRDPGNPYRVWFSGDGDWSGIFSGAYNGGYLEFQLGGRLKPIKAVDYRTGKGDSIATVFMDSADGLGGIIQMSLDTSTIDQYTVIVPSAYLLPGSRGTSAPRSVVNVLNDYFFYNTQAFYNLGSRAQLLNILSTDEASANIRPNVQGIDRAGEEHIAAAYFQANILFSVPISSTVNNYTMVYNTEMKAWLPEAFTIGFKRFMTYTDTGKAQRLLAIRPGDTRLSEINQSIAGDYGVAFDTSLTTGLVQTTGDVFEFQFTEEGEFELANASGTINVELLGIDRSKGFHSIKTVTFNTDVSVTNAGWDTFPWDSKPWDDTSDSPSVSSEPSLKRYFPAQAELNAVQWHIFTNSLEAQYILRTLQTWGTPTQAGHPSKWRLKPI